MNDTIAKLLAERKRLDARIRRAVAKAFPVGSRWHLSGTYQRSRVGTVIVQKCQGDRVLVKWENETDNYDAKQPIWGAASVGHPFPIEPQYLSAIKPSSPASA